jgi:Fibronectin type III domain
MDWLILILGIPAILVPLVLLFGFAGCGPSAFCTDDSDCPGGTQCVDGSCFAVGQPEEFTPTVLAPENLTARALDDHSVLLTWTNTEPAATGFQIERAPEDGSDFTPIPAPGDLSPTGATDASGLQEGVTFIYRVRALVDQDASEPSDTSFATVLPATPVNLVATTGGINQINLSWTNRSTVTNVFSVERRVLGGSFGPIGSVAGNTLLDTGIDIGGLSEGTTYEYQVSATVVNGFENSVGLPVNSAPSAIASATTLAFTTAFTGTLTTDQPGGEGICLVQRLSSSLLAGAGSQVRITLRGSTVGPLSLDNVFISRPDPTVGADLYDADTDLTLVALGVTIPMNNSVTLPPVNYAFDPSKDLLVAFDISSNGNEGNLRFGPLAGADQFGQFSTAEAGVQNRSSGYQGPRPNTLFLIEKIEVL